MYLHEENWVMLGALHAFVNVLTANIFLYSHRSSQLDIYVRHSYKEQYFR